MGVVEEMISDYLLWAVIVRMGPYFTPDNKKISSDVANLGFALNVIESEERGKSTQGRI